jgi:hypothetical protein
LAAAVVQILVFGLQLKALVRVRDSRAVVVLLTQLLQVWGRLELVAQLLRAEMLSGMGRKLTRRLLAAAAVLVVQVAAQHLAQPV